MLIQDFMNTLRLAPLEQEVTARLITITTLGLTPPFLNLICQVLVTNTDMAYVLVSHGHLAALILLALRIQPYPPAPAWAWSWHSRSSQ